MALSYGLEFEAEIEPIQALHIIAESLGLEWDQGILKGAGITVNAHREDDFDKSFAEQEFGFQPGLCVGFRINPNKAYEGGMLMVARATMSLLYEVAGDAVLLFNYETIVLRRIGNQLMFNKNDLDPWIASELDDLTLYKNNTELATA